jgi:hypothetical protein
MRMRDFPLILFMANHFLPTPHGILIRCFWRPRECEQKYAVLRGFDIVGHRLIQGKQVPGWEIHHLPWQVEPDMTVKRVHRYSGCRRVLVHARIRLHSDQHNAKIRVFHKRLRASSGSLQPRFFPMQLIEFICEVESEQRSTEGAINRFVPDNVRL